MSDRSPACRAVIAVAALVACAAVTLPRFVLDEAASIQKMSVPAAVLMTAWWLLPVLALIRLVRSRLLLASSSAAYVVIAASSLAATYRNEHSTAAFGIFFMPPYLMVGVALVALLDSLVQRVVDRW